MLISEIESLPAFATHAVSPATAIPAGCSPTATSLRESSDMSMMLTVPEAATPRLSTSTSSPPLSAISSSFSGVRPAQLLTMSLFSSPVSLTSKGMTCAFHCRTRSLDARLTSTTAPRFAQATNSRLPSLVMAIPPGTGLRSGCSLISPARTSLRPSSWKCSTLPFEPLTNSRAPSGDQRQPR